MPVPVSASISPVRGFRTWSFAHEDGRLHGVTHGHASWQSGVTAASCETTKCTNPPQEECGCGLYAWHLFDPLYFNKIIGVVEGQGRVAWCPAGWRASHARIRAIATANLSYRRTLARVYPDVEIYAEADQLLQDWPPLIAPEYVYGPQGSAVQDLLDEISKMSAEEWYELDEQWGIWHHRINREEYAYLSWTLLETVNIIKDLPRNAGIRSIIRPGPQIGSWALAAVAAADLIDPNAYQVLIRPWATVFGDPLHTRKLSR